MAWAAFKGVLDAHQLFLATDSVHRPSQLTQPHGGDDDMYYKRVMLVVRRPTEPHPENNVLLGNGDGLHSLTLQEAAYRSPFLKAARYYLRRSIVVFPELSDLVGVLRDCVVVPLSDWISCAQKLAEHMATLVSWVPCPNCTAFGDCNAQCLLTRARSRTRCHPAASVPTGFGMRCTWTRTVSINARIRTRSVQYVLRDANPSLPTAFAVRL